MKKSDEWYGFTIIYSVICLLLTFACWLLLPYFYIVPVCMGISYVLFFIYTRKRRKQMRMLSTYLQSVYQGTSSMDIRDYCEGELSVLKSDLYKITNVLTQQAESLRKDKVWLADALSDISHQIRTPLTSMMVVNDLLREDIPDEKRQEFMNLFHSQLERLNWLVSSLLKMSRIDARAVSFHKEELCLRCILIEAASPIEIAMELKHQQLQLKCDENLVIHGDHSWIIEAFSNILKNGMEHAPENSILHVEVEDTPLHTIVYFKDHGNGIDEQDIPHVFERFYKGKNASSDSVGIGLALSRSILIAHDASIQVKSVLHEGTTFIVTFYK